uniref:Uncharacterized protein n=1 Tax=Candidatus Kentrum sp. TC TaxID=2126339 RepID=A0A451ACJ2_9GAMM|nr:MAG: hypothetical protein BECKTC1821E_GA0114239_101114 [Candidatus Kentron sp. TC]VFK45233.1 MAG: hypothetical protein BECKTC1821D_GA0114238_10257 [Candidatus Kentron sp. TC]VFK63767.1 MAG: hypothetical protein BECKTC1821F_GA0114240_11057 [Candidatus Kentron sp. TC]
MNEGRQDNIKEHLWAIKSRGFRNEQRVANAIYFQMGLTYTRLALADDITHSIR